MRLGWLAIPGGLVITTAWAIWPLQTASFSAPAVPVDSAEGAKAATADDDVSAFRAPLWVAPPPPPAPPSVAPPPPPLKLQLLAVIREGDRYKAMLYDPDADRIVVASEGERLGERTVESVSAAGVQIRDGNGLRTLALRRAGDAP